MTDGQMRVVIERDDLKEKMTLLAAKFMDHTAKAAIEPDERMLLGLQLDAMRVYVGVLNARIARWR